MPIYRAKNLPAITIEDPSTPPPSSSSSGPCSWSTFDVDKAKALKELIYICYYHQYDAEFPHKKIYEKSLRYLVNNSGTPDYIPKNVAGNNLFNVTTTGTVKTIVPSSEVDKYPDLLADPRTQVKNAVESLKETTYGWIAESCAIFSMHLNIKRIAEDVGYKLHFDKKIEYTKKLGGGFYTITDTDRKESILNSSSLSNLYNKLVNSISSNISSKSGSTFNSSYIYKKELSTFFNTLFDPFMIYGASGNAIDGDVLLFDFDPVFKQEKVSGDDSLAILSFLTKQILIHFRDYYKNRISGVAIADGPKFFFSDSLFTKLSDAGDIQSGISKTVTSLLDKLTEEKRILLKEDAVCLFNSITKDIEGNLDIYYIGFGEGSDTSGLFGVHKLGVQFFLYLFKNHGGYVDVTNPNEYIQNLKFNKNEILHLTGYGKDMADKGTIGFENNGHFIGRLMHWGKTNSSLYKLNELYIDNGPDAALIGINFDLSNNEISVNDNQDKKLNITYKSSGFQHNHSVDEGSFIVTKISPSPTEPVKIRLSANDLYKNDKFELTKLVTNSLFLKGTDYQKAQKIVEFIKNGATVTIDRMEGYFVGKQIQDFDFATELPSVTPDTNYMLNTYPGDGAAYVENVKDNDANEPIRYSWAEISGTAAAVTITILSYVSPLRSRLDKRFTTDDFRNDPAKVSTFNSDPVNAGVTLPPNPPDIIDLTQNYTLAPHLKDSPPSTVGMLYNLFNIYNDAASTMIPSYNQALACLRNFGLLEAICFRLYDISVQNSVVKTKLAALLNDTVNTVSKDKSETARFFILGNTNPPTKDLPNAINYTKYNQYKWYYLYPRIKNPVTNIYVDDIFEYEYNNYRHDF